ncbi:MAG: hypothetical protein ACREXS_13155 [Gammaproteobacteria bacterium]
MISTRKRKPTETLCPTPFSIAKRQYLCNWKVKASRFNGINLPAIYAKESTGRIVLKKRYDYLDYRDQWVNGADACSREEAEPRHAEARVR